MWSAIASVLLGVIGWLVASFFAKPFLDFLNLRSQVHEEIIFTGNVGTMTENRGQTTIVARCPSKRGLPPNLPIEHDSTAQGVSFVLWIGVLGRSLSGRHQQPGKLYLRLAGLSLDELDQKFPFVAVVEEESHLGPDRREGLDDARPLDAPSLIRTLSHIDKQLKPNR
jgi:hypothetical protein